MSWKDFCHNRWTKFVFWALLYVLWVIWLGNYWWLLGLVIIFDLFVTKKVKWLFWKKEYKEGEKKNQLLEWLDAVIFAIVVVTFLNVFFLQAFKIPSSSMESTLYTGDRLFVEKLTYGPRVPQTPLTIPFTHNVIFGKESYSTLIQNDYRRLKGFREPKNGDIVVFGFPDGDTVLAKTPADDYYTLARVLGRDEAIKRFGPVIVRPADKKDHYVKRCVAIPGDTLQVIDGLVYVNGIQQEVYPGVQLSYKVVTTGQKINSMVFEKMGLSAGDMYFDASLPGYPEMPLTFSQAESLRGLQNVTAVDANLFVDGEESEIYLFPYTDTGWTRDFYGPLWIPRKGATVSLNSDTLPLYERIISTYEGNDLKIGQDGSIFINGEKTETYTFGQDYYFMMGDNRHNSLDSRYWGFVPEDHLVGRPAVIWLSTDQGKRFPKNIRWNRFLKFV